MECTQRLECTQELYDTHTEKICPEQIAFLGICGAKYPVLRGPNKIGRDPQTCSIVLNLNSVSRQHAVINVLNSKDFMIMDLDSANKTKLSNITLQPYIPQPLRNGDTVQFGDIFGIFRLLEEDNDLPMTQALDVPETPLPSKPVSKFDKAPTTVIPESPDVSDRDDSFTTPSQLKGENTKLFNSQYITPFGKPISIQPVNTPKRGSLTLFKQSTSLNFIDNPNTSLNESFISNNSGRNTSGNIHELNTQPPNPIANVSIDSIYTADTQFPPAVISPPSIYSLNTQIPTTENLPQIRKIENQQEMQFNIYAPNKENDISIFNAETQPFGDLKNDSMEAMKSSENQSGVEDQVMLDSPPEPDPNDKAGTPEEEVLFEDVDGDFFEEDLNSQNLLSEELPFTDNTVVTNKVDTNPSERTNRIKSDTSDCEDIDMLPANKIPEVPVQENKQKSTLDKSGCSTDCDDDMLPTQIIPELPVEKDLKQNDEVDATNNMKASKRLNRIQSDSSTDCEDIEMIPIEKIPEKKVDDDETDCEDDVVEVPVPKSDMPTQIIDVDNFQTDKPSIDNLKQANPIDDIATTSKDDDFEDMPTQIVEEIAPEDAESVNNNFQDIVSPFKIPLQSPIRVRSKDMKTTAKDQLSKPTDDENYYNATQELYEDLCSQREGSPDILKPNEDDDVVPCSVEDYKVGEKFPNIDLELSPNKRQTTSNKTVNNSNQQLSVGKGSVAKLIKVPSDSSDVECTPKKIRHFKFTDSDLPNSQEIKTSIIANDRSAVMEVSSESEPENNSEDQLTPFLHRKKVTKPTPKIDLTKKFEIEKLPERVLTRQRKPTSKLEDSAIIDKKISTRILRPTYLIEQEDQIDQDIITENIKRLKHYEKAKSKRDTKNDESVKEDTSQTKTDYVSKAPKEKIKVKIERPKRKATKSKSESENKRTLTKSPEIEVRRSKRHQKTKDKSCDDTTKAPKSILKNTHEESTVYNASTTSGAESPKNLKRSLVDDSELPSPKRTRSFVSNASGINNASLRATPARVMKTQYVLFTAFPSEEVKKQLLKLGAVIVTDVLQCSVVLTMKVKRTFKLLCALGLGRPIVGPGWVQACVDSRMIVDPWLYLVKDASAEKRFKFSLERTLTGSRNFLKGYNVSSTPNTEPDATEMKLIVECSGGTWKEGGNNWLCVSCPTDKALWPSLMKRKAIVVSTELILGGVLRQKLDIASNMFL